MLEVSRMQFMSDIECICFQGRSKASVVQQAALPEVSQMFFAKFQKQFADHEKGVIIVPADLLAYQQGNIEDIRFYSFFLRNEYVRLNRSIELLKKSLGRLYV